MPISPLFQHFVDDQLARSGELLARTLTGAVEQLRKPQAQSPSERQHSFDLLNALPQQQGVFQRAFVDGLRVLVKAELQNAEAPAAAASASTLGGLQLMDETRVETEIEISRAIQALDNVADWELRELQTFTSTLRGQEHVTADSNPLRPQVYVRALWQAVQAIPGLPPVQQAMLLRVCAPVMAGLLRLAWAAACTWLEDQGVQPSIYRTIVYASNSNASTGRPGTEAPPEVDVTQPGALDGLLSSMPSSAPSVPAHSTSHHAAEATQAIERQITELLSRLFATILNDPLLAPPFRAVLARLQASATHIALTDPLMLKTHEHPVWLLMERIAQASHGAPAGDVRLARLQNFCEALVDDMQRDPVPDAELYRRSLMRLDEFAAESLRRAQREVQDAIDTLRLAEQTEQMQQQISARLVEQMVPIRTSAPIRRFVTGPWARVIALAMLKFGDKSEVALAHMKTVDELLWSLHLPDHPQSRQRLIGLLPGLLQRLREGMAFIDLPTTEQQQVLDELMAVHTEALRPGSRTGSATPEAVLSPQDIVQRMRDEVIAPPPDGPPFSDSLIDLSSMETVPAEWLPATSQGPSDDPQGFVRRMTLGERYRLFLHGRWVQTQLLWRSDRLQYFLLSGDTPGHPHSITARALERLREAKLLNTADHPLLIQRAVDGLLRGLSARS